MCGIQSISVLKEAVQVNNQLLNMSSASNYYMLFQN